MATVRSLINRICKLTGEDAIAAEATEIDDDYHILLLTCVNFIKEEVEDQCNWRALWHTETLSLVAASSASVTNTTDRTRLVRIHDTRHDRLVPLVFDVTDSNSPIPLIEIPLSEMLYRQTTQPQTNTQPSHFAVDDTTASTLTLRFHPTPTGTRSIKVTACTPQAELDEEDVDTSIQVPSRAIQMGAIWWALEERGEELGQGGLFTEERYRNALAAEVSREIEEQGGLQLVVV
jgi:hypothetical protein